MERKKCSFHFENFLTWRWSKHKQCWWENEEKSRENKDGFCKNFKSNQTFRLFQLEQILFWSTFHGWAGLDKTVRKSIFTSTFTSLHMYTRVRMCLCLWIVNACFYACIHAIHQTLPYTRLLSFENQKYRETERKIRRVEKQTWKLSAEKCFGTQLELLLVWHSICAYVMTTVMAVLCWNGEYKTFFRLFSMLSLFC